MTRKASGVAVILQTSYIESVPPAMANPFAGLLLILKVPVPIAKSMLLLALVVFINALDRSAGFT